MKNLVLLFITISLTGCFSDGKNGSPGNPGEVGPPGPPGESASFPTITEADEGSILTVILGKLSFKKPEKAVYLVNKSTGANIGKMTSWSILELTSGEYVSIESGFDTLNQRRVIYSPSPIQVTYGGLTNQYGCLHETNDCSGPCYIDVDPSSIGSGIIPLKNQLIVVYNLGSFESRPSIRSVYKYTNQASSKKIMKTRSVVGVQEVLCQSSSYDSEHEVYLPEDVTDQVTLPDLSNTTVEYK